MTNHKLFPLLFVLVLDAMGFGLILPVLNALIINPHTSLIATTLSMHQRQAILGIVLAAFPLAVAIGTPLLGIWSDRIGRKRVLMLGLIGGCVGLIACAMSVYLHAIFLLLAGRLLTGFTSASQPIAQAAAIDLSSEQHKPLNLSLVAFAMTVGMAAGPLLGGFLSDANLMQGLNLAIPFWLAAALSFINLLFLWRCYHDVNWLNTAAHSWKLTEYWQHAWVILRKPSIVCLLVVFILLEISWSLYFQAVPLLLAKQFNYASDKIGTFISFLGITMCIGLMLVFRYLLRYLSLSTMINCAFIAGLLSLISCIFIPTVIWQWLGIIPYTLAVGIAYTAIISQLSSAVDKRLQGWLMGFAASLLALSWALSGLLTGWYIAQGLHATLMAITIVWAVGLLKFKFYQLNVARIENPGSGL